MSGGNFLSALLTFPKDTINDETVELLEPYLSMEDFNIEQVRTLLSMKNRSAEGEQKIAVNKYHQCKIPKNLFQLQF